MANDTILTLGTGRGPRARTRFTSASRAADALAKAKELGRPVIIAQHGGSVANSYGYPAETEGQVVVAFPEGVAVRWYCTLSANKVTLSGVLSTCGLDHRLFDRRCSERSKADARRSIIQDAIAALAAAKTEAA